MELSVKFWDSPIKTYSLMISKYACHPVLPLSISIQMIYIYIHTLVLSPGKKCPHAAYVEPKWHLLLMLCKPWLDSLSMENQWLLCMYVTLHVVRVNRCIYWRTLVWKVFSTSHGCFDICGITVCVYVCRQIWSGRTCIVEATTWGPLLSCHEFFPTKPWKFVMIRC